jgi:hypothetical protein
LCLLYGHLPDSRVRRGVHNERAFHLCAHYRGCRLFLRVSPIRCLRRSSGATPAPSLQKRREVQCIDTVYVVIQELLSFEDQTLLVRRNSLLPLEYVLDVLNVIRGLDIKRDGLSGKGLDDDIPSLSAGLVL